MASAAALEEFIVALDANRRTTYSYGKLIIHIATSLAYSSTVAALCFLAYDIVLSLGQEVNVQIQIAASLSC